MWYIIGAIVLIPILIVGFLILNVGRGARRRDEGLMARLEPVCQKFEAGEAVTPEEVHELARQPELRYMLFATFRELGQEVLLPTEFNDPICQAEASLVYWLMHPNELKNEPSEIGHLEAVTRTVGDADVEYHVFRYRTADGHWAAHHGWMLGLAGPVNETDEPYSELAGAFSRMDKVGDVTPEELVDWWVEKNGQ